MEELGLRVHSGAGHGIRIRVGMASTKCLLLIVCLFGLNIEPSWSSCDNPAPVANATIQFLPPHLIPVGDKYPEGAEVTVECFTGFHLAYTELRYQICTDGKWNYSVNPDKDRPTCVPNQCSRPPMLQNGHFKKTSRVGGKPDDYPVGTIVEPTCDTTFSLNCSDQCGKLRCGADKTWQLMDGKLISECVKEPLHVKSNLSHTQHNEERHSESSIKHYMVLVLGAICVLGVGILTIGFLRRPIFCKKHPHQGGQRTGLEETPVIITSSSPLPYQDSLPVSMNTGIFVPGASYDLQDCHFQDSPLVGTTVFK